MACVARFYLGISFDGNREMHDCARRFIGGGSSYEVCLRGLEQALLQYCGSYMDLEVIVVPDPSNVNHLADGVRFLVDELKVQRVSINPNFYANWNETSLERMRQEFDAIADSFVTWCRNGRVPQINFIENKIFTTPQPKRRRI